LHLYHLKFEQGIEYERAFAVSIDTQENLEKAAEKLAFLHKSSVRKGDLEDFWEKATALGAASLGKALFKESIIMMLRREIRRDYGLLIDPEDLGKSLHDMLSLEAREQIGPMRILRKRKAAKKLEPISDASTIPPFEDEAKLATDPLAPVASHTEGMEAA
jgi:hypothetical protein